jgi:hypothetical protein
MAQKEICEMLFQERMVRGRMDPKRGQKGIESHHDYDGMHE